MDRRVERALLVAIAIVGLHSPAADAEGLLTPFIGIDFGGASSKSTAFGVALGATAGGIIGFEVDVGHTPDGLGDSSRVANSSVTTIMGNLMVGLPIGPVRPYVAGGVGLLRAKFDGLADSFRVRSADLGGNVGGGIMAFFSEHVGVRADVRYFRAISPGDDLERVGLGSFDFWRGAFGVTLRF